MSTEHQRYSLENQADAIAEYALEHHYDIVRTYADAGRSGLSLKGRKALESLLADARNPKRDFSLILVLDVSRWGRFQDPDESASYEYQCREAGVNIEYCAEGFFNDGTFTSTLLKQIKRLMAAEYSRELSHKTWVGQCTQAALGFKQGGQAIYGFRRMLIDEQGAERGILKRGEGKYTAGDHVIFVHGPDRELKTIQRMFRLFLRHNYRAGGIAKLLNKEGSLDQSGTPWSRARVINILKNPLCIGIYAFNRTSTKFGMAQIQNSRDEWVIHNVLPKIVSEASFERANQLLLVRRGSGPYKRDLPPKVVNPDRKAEMLKALKRLLKEKGELNYDIVGSCPYAPCGATYARYFGSLGRACELIGYKPDKSYRRYRSIPGKDISDEEVLGRLRLLHLIHGHINVGLVRTDCSLPTLKEIKARFGSLMNAYQLAQLKDPKGNPLTAEALLWTFRRSPNPVE